MTAPRPFHPLDATSLELEARRMRAAWFAAGLRSVAFRLIALIPHGGAPVRG